MSPDDEQKIADLIEGLNAVLVRQSRLEERLDRLEDSLSAKPVVRPSVQPVPLEPSQVTEPEEIPVEAVAAREPAIESNIGLIWLNRIGVVTLVLGVGFFFKWAVDNNWIGPPGRVMLGLVAGFALVGFADYLWREGQQLFAQGITGAGLAIIYIALYAAFDFYHLVAQAPAFLLLLSTTAMAATLALRYHAIAVASLGFFGAYLIPLLLSNGEDHPWFLMSYLLLLNMAATELAARRNWKLLEVLSFAATTLIFGSWLLWHGKQPQDRVAATLGVLSLCAQRFRTVVPVLFLLGQALTTLSLAFVWTGFPVVLLLVAAVGGLAFSHFRKYAAVVMTAFASFWLALGVDGDRASLYMPIGSAGFLLFTGWSRWRFALLEEDPGSIGLGVFALNGPVFYALAYSVLHREYHHWLGLLALGVAASYLEFGMLLLRRKRKLNSPTVTLALGVSVAFLTLAIPIQLAGFSISIAWSIQAAALSWIGLRLNSPKAVIAGLLAFALAFWHVVAVDSLLSADVLLLNTRFLVFAVLAICLLLSAYWAFTLDRRLVLVAFIAGHIAMLSGLCLEVIEWAHRSSKPENELSEETIGITILFALYAVMLVSVGVAWRAAVNRLAGLVLTTVVVLKLYLYDVWQLRRVYQIIAFVILGILLLSTSFLYSRFKELIREWKQDGAAP